MNFNLSVSKEGNMILSERNKEDFVLSVRQVVKRCFDIVVSGMGMLLFFPVFITIWITIKLTSKGPAVYKQVRIGYQGKPFTLYKFRTMKEHSEDGGVPVLCKENDERLTKIGGFLRSHHLDEMPQLWNVFVGDMSIVGYRPERAYFIEKIMKENPDYELLFQIRPGVFSYATLYNGYTDTMEKMLRRLEMDLDYLHTWTLWTDVKIIFLTLVAILTGKRF